MLLGLSRVCMEPWCCWFLSCLYITVQNTHNVTVWVFQCNVWKFSLYICCIYTVVAVPTCICKCSACMFMYWLMYSVFIQWGYALARALWKSFSPESVHVADYSDHLLLCFHVCGWRRPKKWSCDGALFLLKPLAAQTVLAVGTQHSVCLLEEHNVWSSEIWARPGGIMLRWQCWTFHGVGLWSTELGYATRGCL